MKPFNYKNFTYSGISVSSECPFFPIVKSQDGEQTYVNFNQGYVFNYPDIKDGGELQVIEVSGMNEDQIVASGDKFYLKLTLQLQSSNKSTNVIYAELVKTKPTAGENIFSIKVCEFGEKGSIKEIFLRENIYWNGFAATGGAGDAINHPWKVTLSSEVIENPENPENPIIQWNVKGGTVYTQGVPKEVADKTIAGNYGYILLEIIRNQTTREISTASIKFSEDVTKSDYYNQYRALAFVNNASSSSSPVIQYQFEEIRIYEELVVENGAFKLQGYEVSHRNNYQPPV